MLAFTDMSAAKDQDWFLRRHRRRDSQRSDAAQRSEGRRAHVGVLLQGRGDDLRTIGEKLNVTTILEGSVRRAGDRVRITVQLSDMARMAAIVVRAVRP